jgi:hypothetical protein
MFGRTTREVRESLKKKMPKFFGSIAKLNRWTNEPHKHERERRRNGYVWRGGKTNAWVKKGK